MMHEHIKWYDAWANAENYVQIKFKTHKIGLSIEFLTKTQKKFNHLLTFQNKLTNWPLDKLEN